MQARVAGAPLEGLIESDRGLLGATRGEERLGKAAVRDPEQAGDTDAFGDLDSPLGVGVAARSVAQEPGDPRGERLRNLERVGGVLLTGDLERPLDGNGCRGAPPDARTSACSWFPQKIRVTSWK